MSCISSTYISGFALLKSVNMLPFSKSKSCWEIRKIYILFITIQI